MNNYILADVRTTDILIGERFRKDYGNISSLMESIKTKGLISPICIMELEVPQDGKRYQLIAGGRRLEACTKLNVDLISAKVFTAQISDAELRLLELTENLDRKDMTPQEVLQLKHEIHTLHIKIHGHKTTKDGKPKGWGLSDTAKLLGESEANLSRDLQLYNQVQVLGIDLSDQKSKQDIAKVVKNLGTKLVDHTESRKFEEEIRDKNKRIKKLIDAFQIGDCLETMRSMDADSINFIEIDPPYAIDLHSKKSGDNMWGYNEIEVDKYKDFMCEVLKESYRIAAPDSWLVCWFAISPWYEPLKMWLKEIGFHVEGIPGVWIKPTGVTAQPEYMLGSSYEPFLYCRKGKPKLGSPGRNNVFQFSPMAPTSKWHATQRPLSLMKEIFTTFTRPGQTCYIPFLGSGTSLLAAEAVRCTATGNDLSKMYKDSYTLHLKATIL